MPQFRVRAPIHLHRLRGLGGSVSDRLVDSHEFPYANKQALGNFFEDMRELVSVQMNEKIPSIGELHPERNPPKLSNLKVHIPFTEGDKSCIVRFQIRPDSMCVLGYAVECVPGEVKWLEFQNESQHHFIQGSAFLEYKLGYGEMFDGAFYPSITGSELQVHLRNLVYAAEVQHIGKALCFFVYVLSQGLRFRDYGNELTEALSEGGQPLQMTKEHINRFLCWADMSKAVDEATGSRATTLGKKLGLMKMVKAQVKTKGGWNKEPKSTAKNEFHG